MITYYYSRFGQDHEIAHLPATTVIPRVGDDVMIFGQPDDNLAYRAKYGPAFYLDVWNQTLIVRRVRFGLAFISISGAVQGTTVEVFCAVPDALCDDPKGDKS